MSDQFQYVYLASHTFDIGHIWDPIFLQDLHSDLYFLAGESPYFLSGEYVITELDLPEGALSYRST